jgi:enamine deaminase RidA (YjgF/YER057c/UK114 family)
MNDQIDRYGAGFAKYSEGVSVNGPGRWIYVAGQVALGEDNKLVEGDLASQTELTLDHIERVLRRADAELSDVVSITVYVTSFDDYAAFSEVRARRFGEDTLPTSAVVQVAGLMLGAAIEIDAVAFVPEA